MQLILKVEKPTAQIYFEKKFQNPELGFYKSGKKEEPESPIRLFHPCTKTNFLCMQLQNSFQNVLIIPPITPQSAIFGFTDHEVNYNLITYILLIFKYYVYKTRENGSKS